MEFGTIESIEVGVNLDTGENVRIAQVNIIGEDTVTVELPFPEGDEFAPAVGDTVYYEEVDSGFLVARCIQSVVPVDSSLASGERELFSRDGTDRKAKLRLKKNGEIVLNVGDDYAVKFDKLDDALQFFMTSLNTVLKLVYAHVHPLNIPGNMTLTSPTLTTITNDLELNASAAKVEKVRV